MSINIKKPYCKVCHDSGKPEREYTSHWVKDRTGKTVCPTLLNTECRYCFKLGHTSKFCPLLAKNNKAKERQASVMTKDVNSKSSEVKMSKMKVENIFAALECDSEEEEIVPISSSKEEYPALSSAVFVKKIDVKLPIVQREAKTDWAAIASKPSEVNRITQVASLNPNFVATVRDYSKPIYTKSWADWSDSDTDTEIDDIDSQFVKYNTEIEDDDW